jgi:hypothetical protein
MARLQPETVDRLIAMLGLPVEAGEAGDELSSVLEHDVQRITRAFGLLVFEDADWFEYDASRIEDVLATWLDQDAARWLDALARDAQPAEFLSGFEELITGWRAAGSGAAGPAADGGATGSLGIENPYFAPDEVPGTEFYRYRDDQYLYAASSDAAQDEWKSLEQRYDAYRGAADSAGSDDGLVRGYLHNASVLPGTEYYRQDDDVYLYGPTEFAAADGWKPYEHWQQQADWARNEQELLEAIDSFIAHARTRLNPLA